MPMSASPPRTRALIVLADPVLASTLAAALAHRDVDAVGPFSTVDDALPAVLHHTHLVALLDVGLPSAWALARMLEHWDVPYVILGAADPEMEGPPLKPAGVLETPVASEAVLAAVIALADKPATDFTQNDHVEPLS